MIKKIIIYIYLLIVSGVYANFQVAPQVQKISLDRPSTQKIYLKNGTKKLKKIKIYSERPKNQKTADLYMGDWIIVYPKIVYLKPNSKKIIRMSARPPQGLKNGEYRSHLVFEELPVKKYDSNETESGKVGVNLEILYVLVSTVYGYVGELKYSGDISDYKLVTDGSKTYLLSKITNTGTTALDMVYKITYYKGIKKLKNETVLIGKVMRENFYNSNLVLKGLSKGATEMKIESYYRIKRPEKELKEGEEEYNKFKLEEKIIPIETITKEEYFKKLETEKDKKKEGNI